MAVPPVRTPRLVLRPFRASDFAAVRDGYAGMRPRVYRYDMKAPPEPTRAWFGGKLAKYRRMAAADDTYVFGVFERAGGAFVGIIDISVIRRGSFQWGNLGYAVLNQHYGKGYGTEAARAGLKAAFSRLGFQRVEAAVNLDNRPSLRLARAIGMRRECVRRAFYFEAGAWADHVVFAAVPEDVGLRSRPPRPPKKL